MNCNDVQVRLAEMVSGTIPESERQAIQAHLATCSACRDEHDSLRGVCAMLRTSSAPAVQVDVTSVYQESSRRAQQRARLWRRVAIGVGTAAAVLLIWAVTRLQVHVEKDQLVLRWGPPPEPSPARHVEPPKAPEHPPTTEEEDRLRRMEQLAQALALDLQSLNLDHQADRTRMEAQLGRLREELHQFRLLTEQDITTLTRHVEEILKVKGAMP
jgi:anti-sigma factor RsiW